VLYFPDVDAIMLGLSNSRVAFVLARSELLHVYSRSHGAVSCPCSNFVLSRAQVENMTKKWHVYMTKDGRISLAGLNKARSGYLADAIIDSVDNF
jgi:aspartate/tyrosine/aromatic aminotransferase